MKGDPQVLGLAQQQSRSLGDSLPVRLLRGHDRAPHLLLRLALGQALQTQESAIVLEVSPTRIRACDRLEKRFDVFRGHGLVCTYEALD